MTLALTIVIVALVCGLVVIIGFWNKANTLLAKYDSVDDVNLFREKCEREATTFQTTSKKLENDIAQQKQQLKKYMEATGTIKTVAEAKQKLLEFQKQLEVTRREISQVEEVSSLQEVGFYQRKYDFDTPDHYKRKLDETVNQQKAMIKNKEACACDTEWVVEGSTQKGKKMTDEQIRLTLRAFNGECDAAIGKVRYNNVDRIESRITKCYEAMNKMGATNKILLSRKFLDLKLQELFLTHEHEIAKQEEKERQREIKERIREEEKAEREIAEVQKKAEKEEADKMAALEAARRQLADEHGKHNEKLEALVAKLETELQSAIDRKAKATARASLTKSGHVYVLSNIGTMGESVYKIGMTRRLEPLDRVRELGDASVPFPFDVHAMIYSENAPELENALHTHFDSRRVNLVNLRREYFHVTLKEIQDAVADLHGLVTFRLEPEAEQYRTTLAMKKTDVTAVAG